MKVIDLSTRATKVLAIGRFTEKAKSAAKRMPVMTKEVPATLSLYLSGIIEQWFIKPDMSGPVFIMNVDTKEAANKLLEALPLGLEDMMDFDLIPLGPLTPLRLLINDKAGGL
ncbi:MAG: hypothetical protein C5B52_09125 [Bacteroidetes bacterium]|nr:MAG: hypothetical protein C5B52_09125 [Bacteroidota bacterium]